jgi:hypothetical protein
MSDAGTACNDADIVFDGFKMDGRNNGIILLDIYVVFSM